MLELIIAGVAGVASYGKSKDWVRRRLRYTSLVERPWLGLFAGAATAVVAAPVVGPLPLVGAVTAVALGVGVGAGVATGASQARSGWHPDDE